MRRKTGMLKQSATSSITLAVELFNRPVATAREQGVILMTAHAFEMLLKAVIFQERGAIQENDAEYSFSLERCINICIDDLMVLQPSDRTVLMALKQDRDSVAHDVLSMSDELMWVHLRAAVDIFGRLLREYFGDGMEDVLPSKVLPVAAQPPTDVALLVDREVEQIRKLLAPGTRKSVEARAMIRPMLALDGAVGGRHDAPSEHELTQAQETLRQTEDWRIAFPGLAQLELVGSAVGATTEVSLHLSRNPEGLPTRRARPDEEDDAMIYREVDLWDRYSISLRGFGQKLGLGQYGGQVLIEELRLKEDPDAYRVERTTRGNIRRQGLSPKALDMARARLDDPGFDLEAAKRRYQERRRKVR